MARSSTRHTVHRCWRCNHPSDKHQMDGVCSQCPCEHFIKRAAPPARGKGAR